MKIVDSHIHFWDPDYLRYHWLDDLDSINKPFLPETLTQASGEMVDIEKIVFVQCDCLPQQGLQEVAWVTQLAKNDPRIQAIVAFAPLEDGDRVQDYLEQLQAYPLVKGVRRLIQSEGEGFSTQPDFVSGVQLLADFDYRFDICIKHHQLPDVMQLVEQCPDISFVLDHIGKPDIQAQLFDPWREQIQTLASYPNVHCKISGLVTEADLKHWTREDLKPYIDYTVEVFGIERVMYGGDYPVSLLATNYQEWIRTLLWVTEDLSDDERHQLFYTNATELYGIG